jgi:RNA polymerase sigma-70 factor (ECF subfamily)
VNNHAGAVSATADARGEAAVDIELFDALYREWYRPVVRLCRRRLGQRQDVEGIAQEAFIRAWLSWSRYAQDRPFGPWVSAIARRLCNSEIKVAMRRERIAPMDLEPEMDLVCEDAFEQALHSSGVEHALRSLSPRARRVLALCDIEGWSYDEIAHFEQTTVEAVRGVLKRARATFRTAYSDIAGAPIALGTPLSTWVHRRFDPVAERLHRAVGRVANVESWAAGMALLLAPLAATPAGGGAVAGGAPVAVAPGPEAASVAATPGVAAPEPLGPTVVLSRLGEQVKASVPVAGDAASVSALSDGALYSFTVSPSYDDDHTVFALGHAQPCATTECALLLRSTDGGASWSKLPAEGLGPGRLMLPPSYPEDSRIFAWGKGVHGFGDVLSVSHDAGATFSPLANGIGSAATTMSPLFSAGDPRMLMGATDTQPMAFEYRDDARTRERLTLPLPPGKVPRHFAFTRSYASDRTLVVSTWAPPLPSVAVGLVPYGATVDRCTPRTCETVLDIDTDVPISFSQLPDVLLGWNRSTLHRSVDDGRSFTALRLPGAEQGEQLDRLVAGGSRLFAVTHVRGIIGSRLFVSDDAGSTWAPVPFPSTVVADDLVALPDGAILGSGVTGSPIVCSTDDGMTWAPLCRRP